MAAERAVLSRQLICIGFVLVLDNRELKGEEASENKKRQ